jgi:thiol:disulfide interchange protein DsbC
MSPLLALAMALALAVPAGAETRSPPPAASAKPAAAAARPDLRADIARKLEVAVEDVRPSAIGGLYEVANGADVGYVTTDGKYYVDGDIYEFDSRRNVTEARREGARVALLAGIPDSQAIVFSPSNPKYTLTVFTDVDCGYCRKLHSQIGELNKQGIKVRYLLYPRGGPGSESWRKAEAVWCSANRAEALTRAKRGEDVKSAACATPVAKHFELGHQIGLEGTPAMVTARGQMIGGYLPADRLVEHLKALQLAGAGG